MTPVRLGNSEPKLRPPLRGTDVAAARHLKVDFAVSCTQLYGYAICGRNNELLILSLVEARPRHGYEISKLIEQRSGGAVTFYVASLYPLLYRLEKRGWIQGRWVEKSGQRRRRYYRLTSEGQKVLASQRRGWKAFVEAVNRITEVEHA